MPRYIIRKYVMAKDINQAIRIEKNQKPEEVWIDPDWMKMQDDQMYKGNNNQLKN